MKSKFLQIVLILSIMAALLITIPAVADSSTYELNSSSGVWTSVVGGEGTVTGVGTVEVRWGNPTQGGQKSGLRFDSAGSQSFDEGEVFLLGTLTHMNWPVYTPVATGATLQITLSFNSPDISPDPQFTFSFEIDETTNMDYQWQCADWHTDGNPPCDDMITFPTAYGQESFQIGDKLYTLKIVGFVDSYPNGDVVQQFITREEADNVAYLVGTLSSVLVEEPDITVTKKTNDTDVPSAPGPYLYAGEEVTWQYIVQNTGNVGLTNISVVDDQEGVVTCPETTLAAGEIMTCTAKTGIATAGQYSNTVTATANPPSGGSVSDSDTSYYYGLSPSLSLDKEANVETFNSVGQVITYTFTVENDGDSTLTDVVINDALTGSVDLPVSPSTLGTGETGTAQATYTVTQADIDAGQILNTATASGKDPNDNTVEDQDDESVSGCCANPSIELVKELASINGDPSETIYSQVGDVIAYKFTVTNTGNVTLSNITLNDPDANVSGSSIASLAPGASDSTTFTATYTITQADMDAGSFTNTATVTGNPPSGSPVTDEDTETVEGLKTGASINLIKEVAAVNSDPSATEYSQVGDVVSYNFTVTNDGAFTLSNITLSDPDAVVSGGPISVLAPGAIDSTTFTATHTITQADIDAGSFSNTATVTGTPPFGSPVTDDDSASIEGPTLGASIELVKEVADINGDPGITEYSQVGDIITYEFTITNNGLFTLSNITLTDPKTDVSGSSIASLAPGASDSETFTATYTITQADIDAGTFTNTATVLGHPPVGDPVSDSDSASVSGPVSSPSILLEKSVSSINGDPAATEYSQVGDTIAYTFTITNNGNVTLSNITLSDPKTSVSGGMIASLAPGASNSTNFTATYTVTQADMDAGAFTNTATATGNPPSGAPVSDDDSATVEGPKSGASIDLVKQVAAVNGEESVTEYSQVGDVVSYKFTVTNDGPFTLTNVTLNDPDTLVSGGPIASLAPGASDSTTFTATHVITQADIDAGSFNNTATATGNQPFGSPVTDSDSANIPGPAAAPSIELTKEVAAVNGDPSATEFSQVGDVITYHFTVRNTGNVTLSNITLSDPDANVFGGPIASLAPGAIDSTTFTATYAVTQADMDAGLFTNIATVTGNPPTGSPVSDDDSATVEGPKTGASINLVKEVAAVNGDPAVTVYSQVGDVVTYSFTVTNNGLFTLTNITLSDPDTLVSGGSIASLAPGASDSTTFTASYTITQADIDATNFTNTATATGNPPFGDPVTDDDSASIDGPTEGASISLVKEVSAVNGDPVVTEYSQVGDVISYSFTVTNNGTFTLSNITLSDPDVNVSGGSIASLAPGASDSETFTATYTITQADMDAGLFTNTATVTGNPPVGDPVTDDDSATIEGPKTGASIDLVKEVAAVNGDPGVTEYSQVGDVISYSFTVTNDGLFTLTNITLSDPDVNVSGGSIASLAPGASDSTTFTATYTVTQADIDAGSFTNTATVTGNPPSGSPVTDSDSAMSPGPARNPSISLDKFVFSINDNPAITEYSQVGDVITYHFTITNTGNVTLSNISLSDPKTQVSGSTIASLAPGASDSTTFTATYTVTQADIDAGSFNNTATVTGNSPSGSTVSDDDSAAVSGPAAAPFIELTKEVAAVNGNPSATEFAQVGDVVTYHFTIRNTGNVTLSDITLSDPDANVSGGPIASLAPGASDSTTFTATYTVTQADMDAGSFTNIATATGNPPSGDPVTDDDSATVEGPKSGASIDLVKEVSAINGDPAVTVYSQVGDVITYSFTVMNDGIFTLSNITLSDPNTLVSGGPIASLAPGVSDSSTFTATHVVTQADIDATSFNNTATVTGNPPFGDPVTDDDSESVDGPTDGASISLVKEVAAVNGDPAVTEYSQVGDVVSYSFTVTNNGTFTLSNITLSDPDASVSGGPIASLAPGASDNTTFTATYTITQADMDAGSFTNIATVTGNPPVGDPVMDDDSATIEGPKTGASIDLVKEVAAVNGDPGVTEYSQVGDVISYSFTVTNDGLFTLTNITLTDPGVLVSGGPIASMSPGASDSTTFTATYTVTQADIDAGSFTNTATVSGNPPSGSPVTDSDSATSTGPVQNPLLALDKFVYSINDNPSTTEYSQVGDVITYHFTITNTGNVTLSNITLSDPKVSVSGGTIASLAPGASDSTTFTATYTVTQADIDAGSFTNIATATGYPPSGGSVSDSDNAVVSGPDPVPSISLDKVVYSVNSDPAVDVFSQVGDLITYHFTVTNTGNVTLSNITLSDPDANVSGGPIASLAPGASDSTTFTATHTITQADIDAGLFANTATATGNPPSGDPVTDDGSASIEGPKSGASIDLVKEVSAINGDPAVTVYSQVGDVITYSFTVTNDGIFTLTNINLSDPDTLVSGGPIASLAPGASDSETFTATYTITQADIDATLFTNTATVTGNPPFGDPVTDDDSASVDGPTDGASISLVKEVSAVNGDPAVTEYSQVGDVVSYSFTVTNNGTFTLSNITLSDPDASVSGGPIASLAPGASDNTTFTATYTITQADMDAGLFTNIATVTGNPPVGDPVTDDDSATIEGPKSGASIDLVKEVAAVNGDPAVTEYSQVGDVVSYKFTVTNDGLFTLTNITLSDPDANISGGPIASLAPGASDSTTFTATYTVTQADIDAGSFTNTAVVYGTPPFGDVVNDSDSATISGPIRTPAIDLVKEVVSINYDPAVTEYSQVGDVITYNFTVTNTGNVTLSNITLSDPKALVSGGPIASLAPGASDSTTFTATYTITQADMDAGLFTNTATVIGSSPTGVDVSDYDSATVEGPKSGGSINLVKEVAAINGDPAVTVYSQVGDVISYKFTVTNNGLFTLTDITLSDLDANVSGSPIASLAPGDSDNTTFTATYTITQADIDASFFTNTATVTGNPPSGDPVTDDATASVDGPTDGASINLVKEVSAVNGDPAVTEFSQVGDVISYSFTVTNNGTFTLSDITLTDPDVSVSGGPIASLAPGESDNTTFTATYTITQADIDAGSFTNIATVTGNSPFGNPVSDDDSAIIEGPKSGASIHLEKVADRTIYDHVGELITYTFMATNDGILTLTNVEVNDPMSGLSSLSCAPAQPATLTPGDTMTCTATYVVTQSDIDAGQIKNTATATGKDPYDDPVEDQDDETVDVTPSNPGITLEKTADPQVFLTVGEVITYTFTVTNTGNVTISDIVIDDPLTGSVDLPVTPSTLAPGETGTATATYTITQDDIDNGQVVNTATATGKDPDGNPVEDEDDETIEGPKGGADITLVKSADPQVFSDVGDVITYTFTVTNTGNVTITDIVINDPLTGTVDLPISPSTLEPGETGTASVTYTITQDDVDAGQVTNAATATGKDPNGDPVEDEDDETVEGSKQEPSISLVKTADPQTYSEVGEVITYTFTVTNTGNVTLTDVVINDPLTGSEDLAVSPSTLEPGESGTATATYTITQDDLDSGKVVNTATATGTHDDENYSDTDKETITVDDEDLDTTPDEPSGGNDVSIINLWERFIQWLRKLGFRID